MPAGESEAKAKTKARFEEVFKSYAGPSTDKKKSTLSQESFALETLKNSLDLKKGDDKTILNNTYNQEEGSPRFTKNKLREKTLTTEKVNNNALTEEERQPAKTKKKKKKKKDVTEDQGQYEDPQYIISTSAERDDTHTTKVAKSKTNLEADETRQKPERRKAKNASRVPPELSKDEEEEDEQLFQRYQQQIAEEEAKEIKKKLRKKIAETMSDYTVNTTNQVLNNEVEKKKKKKTVPVTTEGEISAMSLSELQDSQTEELIRKKKKHRITTSDTERVEEDGEQILKEEEAQQKAEAKKRKKKRKKAEQEVNEELNDNATAAEAQPSRHLFDDNLVLGVYVHRTDRLKTDLMVSHPMVKVHVIDEMTGQYVRKEKSGRPVSSFYEQETVDHILPIMTQPYDFKKNKSTVPEWDEQIIFNERFGYFVQETEESPKVMLFFEVLDFMSMDEARANFEIQRHESGFRKIAWAFLKIVGTNGVLNVEGKLRLQLFCPPPRGRTQPNTVEVFEWWKKYPRNRYSSTLYVTVKGLKLPDHVDPCVRSMMALQQEMGSTSYSELQNEVTRKGDNLPQEEKMIEFLKWSRLPGQVCRIPNKPLLSFRGGQMGCFCVRFSNDGKTLACACADKDGYPIVVYEIPSGKVLGTFNGHLSIVYDLCWSRDDKNLLSASSDGTVRIWNVETFQGLAEKVLPHPAFIYAAQYHPFAQYLAVTGGYDCVIRVWNVKVKDVNGQLLQEFDGHKSFINTLCFDKEGLRMFSGDSSGLIIVWNSFVNERSRRHPAQQWSIEKEIQEIDLKGVPVNHLEVHPNGRRLLIHAKDSILRVMDLRILTTKKYTGATNYREKIHSTFTPCGSFLFSGSEDGMAYVWNANTGDQVAVYSELCYSSPLRDVAFHPHEHMVALCAFGPNLPVHVYLYDRKIALMEAESMKELSGSRVTTVPKGPRILSSTSDDPTLQDSTMSSMDRFASAARISLNLQRVKQKLDSVLVPMHKNQSTMEYLYEQPGIVPSMTKNLTQEASVISPGSSNYLHTVGSNLSLPAPSLLSPHSKLRLPSTLGAQLIPQQSSHNGGFSPVGQRFSHAPSLRLQTSIANPSASFLRVEADTFIPVQQTVVALYDYTANRSDELTIHRGEIIQVLYKDNDNWWFGRLANGQQGYFPANYVADERGFEEELSHTLESNPALSDKQHETEERSPTPTKMSAVISKSGKFKIISENDTDTESPVILIQKKKKKKKAVGSGSEAPVLAPEPLQPTDVVEQSSTEVVRKKKLKAPHKHSDASGETNVAFEPDF
ncbi:jouberin isoform X1 [Acipenser ruthenus]|uniref:jouberin isoform X1 n=1 Tax=Acipenser ruthenus TaxID=7906 RepID=UPI00155FA77F|nr:jouberin isoform X1 [Acipenser ruthenus]